MIFYKYTETPTSHIYTIRRFSSWGFFLVFFGLWIFMGWLYNVQGREPSNLMIILFFIWIVVMFIAVIDAWSVLIKQFRASWGGKKMTMQGNLFRGGRFEIEK